MTHLIAEIISTTDEHADTPYGLTVPLTPELLARIEALAAAAQAVKDTGETVFGIDVSLWSAGVRALANGLDLLPKDATTVSLEQGGDPVCALASELPDDPEGPDEDDNVFYSDVRMDLYGMRVDEGDVTFYAVTKWSNVECVTGPLPIKLLRAAVTQEAAA